MKKILMAIVGIGLLIFSNIDVAGAIPIQRVVEITPNDDQIFDDGSYGTGVFWRPSFDLDAFTLSLENNVVEVTVNLSDGFRITVIDGPTNQESVGSGIKTLSGQQFTSCHTTIEFLGVQGDILLPTLSKVSLSEGWGICVNFNPLNLTDTSFSFTGIKYSFTILSDLSYLAAHFTGLPAVFDEGWLGVQTQGEINIIQPVPEPTTILLFGAGLAGLIGTGIRKSSGRDGQVIMTLSF